MVKLHLMAHHQLGKYLTEWSHVTNISQPIWNYLLDAHISNLAFNREITESELQQSSSPNAEVGHAVPSISLAKKKFLGKYAISAEEFSEEMVHNINFCIRSSFHSYEKLDETSCYYAGFLFFWPCAYAHISIFRLGPSLGI
jgi:hypothetical protein